MQEVRGVYIDCDADTILLKVNQIGGAACHEGYKTCFFRKVEGDKVYGQVEMSGPQTVQLKQLGTLDGNRLTFSRPNPTEFLIEGNQMKGNSQGAPRGNPWDITLMKTK